MDREKHSKTERNRNTHREMVEGGQIGRLTQREACRETERQNYSEGEL